VNNMYSYNNPFSPFDEYEQHDEYEQNEINRLIALPKEELELLRAEFYTKHSDVIENGIFEQGSHATNNVLTEWSVLNTATLKRRELDGQITIALRPLAITGLVQKFTFKYHNQLYSIAISHPESLNRSNEEVTKILEEEIQEFFGFNNPIVFDKLPSVMDHIFKDAVKQSENAIQIRPLNEIELFTTQSIEKSLGAINSRQLIHEYDQRIGKSDIWDKLSKVIYNAFFPKDMIKQIEFERMNVFGIILSKIVNYLNTKSKTTYNRSIHMVGYLGVKCFAHEINTASVLIATDLAKLDSIGALVGNLCKQNVCLLADTVGDGKLRYVVICYPLVKNSLAQNLEKFCEYSIREGSDNIKSVSEDNPNIIEISNPFTIEKHKRRYSK